MSYFVKNPKVFATNYFARFYERFVAPGIGTSLKYLRRNVKCPKES
jgi:GTP-dependent phosphoenolpyruvate carboxykinase